MNKVHKCELRPDDYFIAQFTDYKRSRNVFSYCRMVTKPCKVVDVYLQKSRIMGETFKITHKPPSKQMSINNIHYKFYKISEEEFNKHVLMEIL